MTGPTAAENGLTLTLWIDVSRVKTADTRLYELLGPVEVRVECQPGATVEQFLDDLCVQLAVNDRDQVVVSNTDECVLPSDAPVSGCQLLQYQTLTLWYEADTKHMAELSAVLSNQDMVRLVLLNGESLAFSLCLRSTRPMTLGVLRTGALALFDPTVDLPESCTSQLARLRVDKWAGESTVNVTRLADDAVIKTNGKFVGADEQRIECGGILTVEYAPGKVDSRIRVMRAADHDAIRNQHGYAGVSVASIREAAELQDEFNLQLQSKPTSSEPKLDLREVALQDGSMLVMALGLMFAFGGFQIWRLLYLALPVGRVVYRFYKYRKQLAEYDLDVSKWKDETLAELGALHARAKQEAKIIVDRNPAAADQVNVFRTRDSALWSRRISSPNFGRVALGAGVYVSPSTVKFSGNLTSPDRQAFQHHADQLCKVPQTPLEHNLRDEHLCLSSSDPRLLAEVTGAVLLRSLAAASPVGLKLAVLLPDLPSIAGGYDWLAAVPHVRGPAQIPPQDRVRYGRDSANDFLERVISRPSDDRLKEWTLIVAHDSCHLSPALLAMALAAHPGNVRLLWLASSSLEPPLIVRAIATFTTGGATFRKDSGAQEFTVDSVPIDVCQAAARSIGPLVDDSGQAVSAGIPTTVPLSRLTPRIEQRLAIESLEAVLGETATRGFELDLVKAGPHVLIGGTTGSGKSELLRTLALSIAARYAPEEAVLLLIDYKGGASFKSLRNLPHRVGFVSNLGEDDVARCIDFLTAELERRQGVLADFEGDYTKYRKETGNQLPRMVVIIDEFGGFSAGTNKARQKAILEIAARGRSQGVHLILATQSPRSVVSEEVRANVNARLCLRTLDGRESSAVLGEEIASLIPLDLKGRTYARLDNGSLVEFQSGFSQSKSIYGRVIEPVVASRLEFAGRARRVGAPGGIERPDDVVLIERLEAAYRPVGVTAPVSALPPSMQPVLQPSLVELDRDRLAMPLGSVNGPFDQAIIGVCDKPRELAQDDLSVDLRLGALLAVGGARSGRTHLLAVVAAAAARCTEPPIIVGVDGGGTGELCRLLNGLLGDDWGWDIGDDLAPNVERLVAQLALRSATSRHVLVLIDRLDLVLSSPAATELTRELTQIVASGSKRGIRLTATIDERTTINDDLKRAFRFVHALRSDGTRILCDQNDLLSRVFTMPPAETFPGWVGERSEIGVLDAAAIARRMTNSPRVPEESIRIFFDDVRQVPVDLDIHRSLAVVGPRASGISAALDRVGQELYTHYGSATPCLQARAATQSAGHWDVFNGALEQAVNTARLADQYGSIPPTVITNVIDRYCSSVPRLAIFDLDYLELYLERLGFDPQPTLAAISRQLSVLDTQVLASGPISILQGKTALTNRISDRIRRTESNFIMLQPPDADAISGDLGLSRGAGYLLFSARPGRIYAPEQGYAFVDGVRYDGHVVTENQTP